jgi:hypothetical protein
MISVGGVKIDLLYYRIISRVYRENLRKSRREVDIKKYAR